MKLKISEDQSPFENLIIIMAFIIALLIIGILLWKLVSPFLAVVISVFISYIFYLRGILGGKK